MYFEEGFKIERGGTADWVRLRVSLRGDVLGSVDEGGDQVSSLG